MKQVEKSMRKLKKMTNRYTTYLAGGMQFTDDNGAGWRNELIKQCNNLDIDFQDPVKLEKEKLESLPHKTLILPKKVLTRKGEIKPVNTWMELCKSHDKDQQKQAKDIMRAIKEFDLMLVAKCDFLIVKWDESAARGSGTRAEIEFAHERGIPVLLIEDITPSAWTTECVDEFFQDTDDLVAYLHKKYK